MKIFSTALLIFLYCVSFYAQDKKEPATPNIEFNVNFDDGCGSPLVESQTYGIWMGKVVKITDDNKLVLGKRKIELSGIDKKVNKSQIKDFLTKNVLNKKIYVQANPCKDSDKNIGGVVQLSGDNKDIDYINIYLLENGIAKFKDFSYANLVPYYMPCHLQKAEERAKTAKLGIWAK